MTQNQNSSSAYDEALKALTKVLKRVPRMHEVASLEELFARGEAPDGARRFCVAGGEAPLEILVSDHFDLTADALVNDAELGTLGLIHVLSPDVADKTQLRQRIDEAAYLRHLLLEDLRPGSVSSGASPYAVEVVFVLPASAGRRAKSADGPEAASLQTSSDIGEVLRDIMGEGAYLDAIGVNLWRLPAESAPAKAKTEFRRAFSWLLVDAESWYHKNPPDPASAAQGRLTTVELRDFRVAGSRCWELDPDNPLHLVHGPNGSGKSSLCEALELAVTGKIERLADADHAKVITNRTAAQSNPAAEVALKGLDERDHVWKVGAAGIDPPLMAGLAAASFRMDQPLADALSQGDSAARARLFLKAFFPQERDKLDKRDATGRRAAAVLEKIPKRLHPEFTDDRGRLNPSRAASALAWLTGPSVKREELARLLPFDKAELAAVRVLFPAQVVQRLEGPEPMTVTDVEETARLLDGVLRGLADNIERKIEVLDQAVRLLEEFGDVPVTALAAETEDLGKLMNCWLENLALADLLEKENQVLATVEEARGRGYVFDPQSTPALAASTDPVSAEDRRTRLARVRAQRDESRLRVAGFTTAAEREARAAKPLPSIEHRHPESLDQAVQWGGFGPAWDNVSPTLGTAVREAFVRRQVVEVKSASAPMLRVGEPGWGKELLLQARRSREAFRALAAHPQELRDPAGYVYTLWTNLRQLQECVSELARIDADVLTRFLQLIGGDSPLRRAINEVMALLTPARWAYEDIITRAELETGEQKLDVRTTDGVPAQLRLNTAELNTFALTLFLLCARRTPNPLRMIVLDDPLQNMDELTVTTVARGLGRLLRLWQRAYPGDSWRLLMMLHGEGNLERIRNEIPCVAYSLPWLSPHDEPSRRGGNEPDVPEGEPGPRGIRRSDSRLKLKLQPLDQLITAVSGLREQKDQYQT